MAARTKRGSRGSALPPRPDRPGVLKLTKKDVVRRELATAIRLYITGGDPVAIYVLASAAAAILHGIGTAAGKETWRTAYLERIQDEYRDAVAGLIDEPFNFMKHALRDPNVELSSYDPEVNGILIFLLCRDYAALFSEMVPEISIFMAVHGSLNPRLLKSSTNPAFDEMVSAVKQMAGTDVLDMKAGALALANFDEGLAVAKSLGISL